MKSTRIATAVCSLVLGFSAATGVLAAEKHNKDQQSEKPAQTSGGKLVKVTEKDAAWAAKERASYPMKVCVASDEKLGAPADTAEFIYREKGKPDRLVIFCCDGCEDDFNKEPAKYLAKLDAAAKAAKK